MSGLIIIGAGPGLGASLARRFAREGFAVSLVARRAKGLAQIQDALASYDVPVGTYPADVGQVHQLQRALAASVVEHGAPDVVIYNAAIIRADAPGDLSIDEMNVTLAVNLSGALVAALATIPGMQERHAGTFLVTGGLPRPVSSRFSLSLGKAGLRALTSMLADHYGPSGVHVATVTVTGEIRSNSAFDPDLIAEEYWRLHRQPPDAWQKEHLFDGSA